MKKNDSNMITELLNKLQASYAAPTKKDNNAKKKKADATDREIEDKLREVLSEVTPTSQTKTKKSSARPAKREEAPVDTESEPFLTAESKEESIPTAIEAEEAIEAEVVIDSATLSKKERKSKKTRSTKSKKEVKTEEASTTFDLIEEIENDVSINEEISEVLEELPSTEEEISEVSEELPSTEEEILEVSEEIPSTEEEISEVSEELPSTKEEISEISEELPPTEEEISEIPEELPSTEEEISEVSEDLPSTEENIEEKLSAPIKPISASMPNPAPKPAAQVAKEAIPIRITPKPIPKVTPADASADTRATALESASNEPIVIRPSAYKEESHKSAPDRDTIVIRPRASTRTNQDAIAIRPHQAPQVPSPSPIEPELSPNEPIRIGKKVESDMSKQTVSKESAKSVTPEAEVKKTVSAQKKLSPTGKEALDKEASRTSQGAQTVKGGSSAPTKQTADAAPTPKTAIAKNSKTAAPKGVGTVKKAISKSASTTKKKTQATPTSSKHAQEDERFEEVLDELAEEQLTIDTVEPAEDPDSSATEKKNDSDTTAKNAALYETVRRRSGLNEDDIAMMFELGYENELGRIVGYETLKQLKYEHLRLTSQTHRKHYRTALGYRGEEYGGTQDKDRVLAAYAKDRNHLIVRVVITALVALLLLFVNLPQIIGIQFSTLLDSHTAIVPALELVLLVVCSVLSIRQLNAGIRQFFKFAPTPYSVCALILPFYAIYTILAFFLPLPPFGFAVAISVLITVLCDVLRLSCELRAFHVISAEGRKTALRSLPGQKKKLRRGDKIVKIISDDTDEVFYRVCTTEQTIGFFRRFNSMNSAARPFTVLLGIMLVAAPVCALVFGVITLSLTSAITAFMTAMLACTPICAVFSYFYPLFRANLLLSHVNCTIIGEEGVEEFDREKTVIFDDVEALEIKKIREHVLREDGDMTRDRRLSQELFCKLGGTLGQVIKASRRTQRSIPVSIVRVSEGGIEAMIDNKYHVLFGKEQFLVRNGLKAPKESTDAEARRTPNVALCYFAVDGVLRLSYEIEYAVKSEFEEKIAELAYYQTSVGIHTYDPNVTEEFLDTVREKKEDTVRVIRPGRFEEDEHVDVLDTGAVTLGAPQNVVSVLYTATGVGDSRRFGMRMQTIASIIGMIGVILLTLFGKTAFLGVLPIALYQLIWIVVSLIATHSELNRSSLHLDS